MDTRVACQGRRQNTATLCGQSYTERWAAILERFDPPPRLTPDTCSTRTAVQQYVAFVRKKLGVHSHAGNIADADP